MAAKLPCPTCGALKTMSVPDSAIFFRYACQHGFAPEKRFVAA